jgi:UDP-N-acetylmuramate dehydrogenase
MNAGGAFGQIADAVERVHGVDRAGRDVTLERAQIAFGYRYSWLNALVITSVELRLTPGDAGALRERLKEVMAYKKRTQPMSENCAGCVYKNPEVSMALAERLGAAKGEGAMCRVSAGMVLDRAGCKGMTVASARISDWHANFFTVGEAKEGGKARDVIELMEQAERRVFETFGVRLEREVVVWRRG